MKLKTLVGSLMMLGVVSTSVYAAPKASQTQNSNSAQINSLTQRIQKLEATINRNQDNAANDPSAMLNSSWFQNVTISGEFEPTMDWMNHTPTYSKLPSGRDDSSGGSSAFVQNKQTTGAYLNTAELYIDAQVNSFTDLHTALDYDYNFNKYGSYSSGVAYELGSPAYAYSANKQEMFFSEANVRFSNLAKSGFYSTIGQQYFNFGSYQHDAINKPLTELLSETNNVGATVGYVSDMGFNVDGYMLSGNLTSRATYTQTTDSAYVSSPKFNTWGASAGYAMQNSKFGLNFQVDFLNNMAQTIYLSHTLAQNNANTNSATFSKTYYQATPGLSAHVGFNRGAFKVMFDYVTALKRFAASDLATEYATGSNPEGAKPEATQTQWSYDFNLNGHVDTPYIAYQTSSNTEAVYGQDMGGYYMPKKRWTFGNKYAVATNVNVNLEYDHDKDYQSVASDENSGSGRTSEAVFLGLDVKF